jgi:hypothetical protein
MSRPANPGLAEPSAEPRACQNCAAPLTGPFCGQCGQHDIDYHRSFHHLIHDLLENVFHFEGKFFVTVAWLLAKPGRITVEFLAGRRMSQLNPLRFYIFVSVMFFLGLSLLNHGHLIDFPRQQVNQLQLEIEAQAKQGKSLGRDLTSDEKTELSRRIREAIAKNGNNFDRAAIIESVRQARTPPVASPGATPGAKSAATPAVTGEPGKPPLPANLPFKPKVRIDRSSQLGQSLARKLSSGELTVTDIWDALEHRVPTLLFLGVPLFALFLKLFYLGSGRYYVEHLIFSLHLHTWLFLVFMVGNGYLKLASLGPSWLDDLCGWALALWVPWYFFRSFRVVYAQGRAKTAWKILLLGGLHAFALLALTVALMAGTVAWLAYE